MSGSRKYHLLVSKIKKRIPDFKIRYKDESLLHKIIAKVMFFNSGYFYNCTTTIGATVWFPSKRYVEANKERAFNILAHEYVHLEDFKGRKVLSVILYLFPQCLGVLSLFAILGFFLSNFWFLWLFALFFLLPIPAPFRCYFEKRAYAMNLAIKNPRLVPDYWPPELKDFAKKFFDSSYYFMRQNDGNSFEMENKLKECAKEILYLRMLKRVYIDIVMCKLEKKGEKG